VGAIQEKIENLGLAVDEAFGKYKKTFATQVAFTAIINLLFFTILLGFGYLALVVIQPSIPNFMGNQPVTDGVFLGIFAMLMLILINFFLMWQNAASVIICEHGEEVDFPGIIKKVGRSAGSSATVMMARILMFVPVLTIFGLIAALNLANIIRLTPFLLVGLFVLLIFLRTISFFAINVSIANKYHFFKAVIVSGKIVMRRGPIAIYLLVAIFTAVNIILFSGLFLFLLNVFGIAPIFDLIGIINFISMPQTAVALILAYFISVLIAPKTQILAWGLYRSKKESLDADEFFEEAGLASRTLAVFVDLILAASVFFAVFYGMTAIISGNQFSVSSLNLGSAITTIIGFFVIFIIYNIYFEIFENGQTVGKRLLGLVVTSEGGKSPVLLQSLVRNVLRIIDVFGFIAIIFNAKHKRLGDFLSLTTVKYKRNAEDIDVF